MTNFFNIYIYNYIYIYVDIFIIVFYLPFYCNIRYVVLSFDVIKKILNFKKKKKKTCSQGLSSFQRLEMLKDPWNEVSSQGTFTRS